MRFVENVKFLAITLHNFLISRSRIQLNGYCNASFTAILGCIPCFSSNWWKHSSNLSFYRMSNKVNIISECCFDVTLVDFEQIRMISYNQVLNDQMSIIAFPGIKQIWNDFYIISLKVKQSPQCLYKFIWLIFWLSCFSFSTITL